MQKKRWSIAWAITIVRGSKRNQKGEYFKLETLYFSSAWNFCSLFSNSVSCQGTGVVALTKPPQCVANLGSQDFYLKNEPYVNKTKCNMAWVHFSLRSLLLRSLEFSFFKPAEWCCVYRWRGADRMCVYWAHVVSVNIDCLEGSVCCESQKSLREVMHSTGFKIKQNRFREGERKE